MAGHHKNKDADPRATVRMELTRPLFRKLKEIAEHFHTSPGAALFASISAMHTASVGPPPRDDVAPPAPRRVHRAHSSPTHVADVLRTLSGK